MAHQIYTKCWILGFVKVRQVRACDVPQDAKGECLRAAPCGVLKGQPTIAAKFTQGRGPWISNATANRVVKTGAGSMPLKSILGRIPVESLHQAST